MNTFIVKQQTITKYYEIKLLNIHKILTII